MAPDFTFFGTSPRSADFLSRIVSRGLTPTFVVSAPPKPVGRKGLLTENPVVTTAKKFDIPITENLQVLFNLIQSVSKSGDAGRVENSTFAGAFGGKPTAGPEPGRQSPNHLFIGLILDFNKIIPQNIIDLFPRGIINIHFSKLPQDRGPSRGEQFILRGDPEAWISYFLITAGLDEGPLLAQTSLPLNGKETFGELSAKLVTKAAAEIGPIINDYQTGRITPRPQHGQPTYARKVTKKDLYIPPEELKAALQGKIQRDKGTKGQKNRSAPVNLCTSAPGLDRLIRAASPAPGAWTFIEVQRDKGTKGQKNRFAPVNLCTSAPFQKRLKLLKAHLEGEKLILDEVQLEGKNPVSWKQFSQGYPEADLCPN